MASDVRDREVVVMSPEPYEAAAPKEEENAFQSAYREYLTAVQQAWAEVDIDAAVANFASASASGFNCLGCVGSLGTAGTVGGTFGSAGTAGTLGCGGGPQFSAASYGTAVGTFATVGTSATSGTAGVAPRY